MDMKRVGSFNVTDATVFGNEEAMAAVQKLMGEVFVTSCIHNFGYGRFEYIGFSSYFDEVQEGYIASAYTIEVEQYGEEGAEYYVAHFNKDTT